MIYSDLLPQRVRDVRQQIEIALEGCLSEPPDSELIRAARYATLGGGHRWRGLLAVAAGAMFTPDPTPRVLPLACSLEMLHAASLVLDDLPSMDDAALRRQRACVHLTFPRWAVDMLPAFLVNLAYRVLLENPRADAERRIRVALRLGRVGQNLAFGQEMDLTLQPASTGSDCLLHCYRLKTAELFAAGGAAAADLCGANEDEVRAVEQAGLNLGLAYQLDNIAEVDAGVGSLGEDANKCTAVSLYGLDGAQAHAERFTRNAIGLLDRFGSAAEPVRDLIAWVNT